MHTLEIKPEQINGQYDARQIQGRHLPQQALEAIIAHHTNEISDRNAAMYMVWKEGRINPRVALIADYVNAMFEGRHKHSQVVSYDEVGNVYAYHFELTNRDPGAAVALSALTTLTHAAELIGGRQPQPITAYLCHGAAESALAA